MRKRVNEMKRKTRAPVALDSRAFVSALNGAFNSITDEEPPLPSKSMSNRALLREIFKRAGVTDGDYGAFEYLDTSADEDAWELLMGSKDDIIRTGVVTYTGKGGNREEFDVLDAFADYIEEMIRIDWEGAYDPDDPEGLEEKASMEKAYIRQFPELFE